METFVILPVLSDAIRESRPDFVFHLAAQALVLDSYKDPHQTFTTNVTGTLNILEAMRKNSGIKAAVMVTSDKCYENSEWVHGYRESDPLGGKDPYSASKGAAEIVISSYIRSFFHEKNTPAVASVRAGNVIGGGDWSENRIIPDCIRSLRCNHSIELRNPTFGTPVAACAGTTLRISLTRQCTLRTRRKNVLWSVEFWSLSMQCGDS